MDPLTLQVKQVLTQVATRLKKNPNLKKERLLQFVQKFPTSPILNITYTPAWNNSNYKFIRQGDPVLTRVLEVLGNELTQMLITELYLFLISTNPYFNAIHGNISDLY